MNKATELTQYYYKATTTSATASTSQTSTSTSAATSTASESHGTSTNTGAIAGGVVGGVCGALLILGLIWFILRRRRSSSAAKHEAPYYTGSEPGGYPTPPEYHNATQTELHGSHASHEVPGDLRTAQELPGNNHEAKSLSELS